MKKVSKAPIYVLFFAIITAGTVRVEAQKFRGFYGSNSTTYPPNVGRYYKPVYSKHHRNRLANSPSVNYRSNPATNAARFFVQPFQGFYPTTYPPAGIIINILPAGTTSGNGMYNYYKGPNRNEWDYNNFNRVPNGSRTVKINGDWFYEIDGNYYRADNIQNLSNTNMRLSRYERDNYNITNSYNDEKVGYVTDRNRSSGNAPHVTRKKQPVKTVYVNDSYEGENMEYASTRQVDNQILISQKEQEALKSENKQLRQAEQQRLAKEKEIMDAARKRQIQENERAQEELYDTRKRSTKEIDAEGVRQNEATKRVEEELNDTRKQSAREIEAERKRQNKENKQAEEELNNTRKQNAKDIEQARRDQKNIEEKRAKEQQEADKEYEKRRMEATRNNGTDNELYSNLKIGDTVDQIPKNSKEIKIDGKKMYVSPRNVYYRKEQGKYRVVGMQ